MVNTIKIRLWVDFVIYISLCALLLMPTGCALFPSKTSLMHQPTQEPVIFIHGGTIDDFVSYLLLTTMEHIDLQAVILTHTDTISSYAMQIQWKMMQIIDDSDRVVALSDARGWNPFPWLYRSDAIRQYKIDLLSSIEDNESWPPHPSGDDLLNDILEDAIDANNPATILITCPLTPLSDVLQENPKLQEGINRVIWMGGAINVNGNLDSDTIPQEVANLKAEWNAFWDPYAVDWIYQHTTIPIILFPLDVTDQAPITKEFMEELELQAADYQYSDLVYQSYSLVGDEPFFEMWNTLTTVYLAHPEFFNKPESMNLVIETEGLNQGAITQLNNGRLVDVVLNIRNKEAFYKYVLEQFRRNKVHESE